MWRSDLAPRVASKYLSGLGRRWGHVRGVGQLADALLADGLISEHVAAAAWLHDLGYAEELSMSGFHPADGAGYLKDEGAPDEVVGLVANHTGALFEAEERGLRELLARFPRPRQDDLDVVTFLDLVTAPTGRPRILRRASTRS